MDNRVICTCSLCITETVINNFSQLQPGKSVPISTRISHQGRDLLAQIQAEVDEINVMVGLEGKAEVDKTEKQRREVVKAEVLLQEIKEEIEIIRGQCDDLIEQRKKAKQKHEIQWQLCSEKLDQYREQLKQLKQLVHGETEKEV